VKKSSFGLVALVLDGGVPARDPRVAAEPPQVQCQPMRTPAADRRGPPCRLVHHPGRTARSGAVNFGPLLH
jgi:hypothetical protein